MEAKKPMMFDLIYDLLSYEDVLALRSTCKDMKEFIDVKWFKKLNLFVQRFSACHKLFYTNKLIGYPQSYHTNDPNVQILASSRFKQQFVNVRQMIIKKAWNRYVDVVGFNLHHLNHFKSLRHLEIIGFGKLGGKLNCLTELQIAVFQKQFEPYVQKSTFNLSCPKLTHLKTKGYRPKLTRTDQLEYLYYDDDGRIITDYLQDIRLNLRKLKTICIEPLKDALQLLNDLKLSRLSLAELKEIRVEQCEDFGRMEELATCLADLKKVRRLKFIAFIFVGKLITDPSQLRQIGSLVREHDNFDHRFLRDSSLLFFAQRPELDFLLSATWKVVLSENTKLSDELISKLGLIDSLELRNRFKPSQSTFELFAKTCRSLRYLILHKQKISQQVLQMMADHLENLIDLKITKCRYDSYYETLTPLVHFRNLERFDFDCDPTRDVLNLIFKNPSLETLFISCRGIKLRRTVTGSRVHRITLGCSKPTGSLSHSFDNLDEMIEYCDKQRLFEDRANEKQQDQ